MKYTEDFTKNWEWHLKVCDSFDYGMERHPDPEGIEKVQHDPNGKTAKECFYLFYYKSIVEPTKEPEKLSRAYKAEQAVDFYIKSCAESADYFTRSRIVVDTLNDLDAPKWVVESIEVKREQYLAFRNRRF